jgi:hypothetical protein
MTQYRVKQLDMSIRIEIGLKMVMSSAERGWGWVTEMAAAYGVSRQTFYDVRDDVRAVLEQAVKPQAPGPKPTNETQRIDAEYIRWATTVLAMQKGSTRDVQLGLELLFGVKRSVGFISETLNAVGQSAADYNAQLRPGQPIQGEADEVFQRMMPCFTVVDGQSFMVLNLSAEADRSGETWAKTFERLVDQGIEFQDIVSDNASGIRRGLREAGLDVVWRLDVFHMVQEGHRISQKLENAAYKAMHQTERAQAYAADQTEGKRRVGRPRQAVKADVDTVDQQQTLAIAQFDLWTWLLSEVRFALEPVHGDRLNNSTAARAELEVASELMQALDHPDIAAFATRLLKNLDVLLDPLRWLEQQVADWQATLDPADEALIVWACRCPAVTVEELPEQLHLAAQAYDKALALLHRASSHVESFHSWLRPYLTIHRTLPDWLLPLAALFWNHHTFQRGKRVGHSPVELAGIDDAPSLQSVLRQVCHMAFGGEVCPLAA